MPSVLCITHQTHQSPSPQPILMKLIPTATYTSPLNSEQVNIVPGAGPHSTNGRTTQISDIVINAGGQDRDQPSAAKNTQLGELRAQLTTLQDKINELLTSKMAEQKKQSDADLERRILDEGVDESDSD